VRCARGELKFRSRWPLYFNPRQIAASRTIANVNFSFMKWIFGFFQRIALCSAEHKNNDHYLAAPKTRVPTRFVLDASTRSRAIIGVRILEVA
jgi:hypothetical protein